MTREQKQCVRVFLAYVLLTLVMTCPVVIQMDTHLVGDGDDMWVHYWNGWWVKRALQQGEDIHFTRLLFHPTGVSLLYHNFAWINIALWLVLEPFIGGIAAYNLTFLVHIPLCGLGMFLLVRHLIKSDGAAFVSGLVFAFWPYRMLDTNHPNMISTEGFPLLMLALMRLIHGRRSLRDGVVAGLLVALIGYTRWQLLILASFMAALYLLYTLVWERELWSWQKVAGLALTAAVATLLMLPALTPLVREQLARQVPEGIYAFKMRSDRQDLLAFIFPQHQHPLSSLYDRLLARYTHSRTWYGYSAFPGTVAVGLAVVGAVRRCGQKKVWFWVGLAVLCFVMAVGPYPVFDGVSYTGIPLPYRLIGWLLPIKLLRYPHRFNALLAVPIAVLAGYGTLALREWLERLRSGDLAEHVAEHAVTSLPKLAFTGLLGLLILLDYCSIPTSTVPAHVPDFYSALAEEAGDFAIAGLPGDRRNTEFYMFYQTVHARPLLGGHVSRLPPQALEFMSSVPLLERTYKKATINTQLPDVSRQLSLLAQAGFRYVVLHKDLALPEQLAEWQSYLVVSPRYEDDEVVVYSTTPSVGLDCPLKYDLGAGMGLIQASLSAETINPDAILEFQVVWGTTAPPGTNLQLEVALVDEEGNVGQMRHFGISPAWPTGEWPANTIVRDEYSFQIEPWLSGGTHTIVVGLVQEPMRGDSSQPVGRKLEVGEIVMLAPERTFTVPPMSQKVEVTFGDGLRLLGYDLEIETSAVHDVLHVALHWQALHRLNYYKVFVHLYDSQSGALLAQQDTVPRNWAYPTHWWEAGEVVSDEITLLLEDVPAGNYRVAIGVYDPDTLERLPVQIGDGVPLGDHLELEDKVHIP